MKRLGRRLRKAEQPSPDDVAMYDAYRESFNEDLHDVMGALQSLFPDSPPAARRKTLDSVVAKLKRSTTDLGSMQDIAGCRINVPSLDDQDGAVAQIQERFEARKTDDLRDRPHSGYRAVHVIVAAPHGRWVEIQVRTALTGPLRATLRAHGRRLRHRDEVRWRRSVREGDPAIFVQPGVRTRPAEAGC